MFELTPRRIPTTERAEFKAALELARRMGYRPSMGKVREWATLMKKALA